MRRFEKGDIETLNAWRHARGLEPMSADDLGEIGWLEEGVAMGFLLRTEIKGLAILDAFHTNPKASLDDRHLSISLIIANLEAEARIRGIRKLGGWTTSRGMSKVCQRVGYSRTAPHVALVKELS